jgi:hypothetical protein
VICLLVGGTDSKPLLEKIRFSQLPGRTRRRQIIRLLRREADARQTCFYTGVKTYIAPAGDMRAPWHTTRDHLVPRRNGGAGQGSSNISLAGRHVDRWLSHKPLPLKLYLREQFRSVGFSGNPTRETADRVSILIRAWEEPFRLGQHFPWQPQCYPDGTRERRMADDFSRRLRAEEVLFLGLDGDGRRGYIDEFRWPF